MSSNINDVEKIKIHAWMYEADRLALLKKHSKGLPERCFLRDDSAFGPVNQDGKVMILDFDWSGVWSGHALFDGELEDIAKCIHGTIEALFFWDSDGGPTGLRIVDGKMTMPTVTCTLEPEPMDAA